MFNRKEYNKQYYLDHDGKRRTRIENINRKGENNPNWKDGKNSSQGYIWTWVGFTNPFFLMNHNHYIEEHRLVMAQHLGRCLRSWEIVHHINEIRDDNRLENLQLMTQSEHITLHKLKEIIWFNESK